MTKIAISLPDEVLEEIETARKDRGESRSKFVRRAVDAYLRREEEDRRRYIEGYRKFPETAEEMDGIWQTSQAVLASIPYESEEEERQ